MKLKTSPSDQRLMNALRSWIRLQRAKRDQVQDTAQSQHAGLTAQIDNLRAAVDDLRVTIMSRLDELQAKPKAKKPRQLPVDSPIPVDPELRLQPDDPKEWGAQR